MKINTWTFFLILIILFQSTLTFEVPDDLKEICSNGCNRYHTCDKKQKKCVFKGFFPIYPLELLQIFILMLSSALATSCGIGGGAVYSSLMLGVEEFQPSEAFPISNCLILGCGFVTFISFTLDKYEHPKNKFIQYDIAVVFGTSMLIGLKFGAIFNRILSSTLLLVLLLGLIVFTTYKTHKNVEKQRAKERKLDELTKENFLLDNEGKFNNNFVSALNELSKDTPQNVISNININQNNEEKNINKLTQVRISEIEKRPSDTISFEKTTNLLSQINIKDAEDFGTTLGLRKVIDDEDRRILNEDADPLNWPRIKFLLLMECLVIVDQFLEGSQRLPSFIGIEHCSFTYWLIFISFILVCLYMMKVAVEKVKVTQKRKKELIPDFNSEPMNLLEKNIYFVVGVAICAGIVSSSLGIGGGMITNPLFASIGMDPKESSSTSNFLIIVAAIATTVLFVLSGQLNIPYTLCLGLLCVIAALIGSFYILKYINRTGRSSILLIIMEYFLIASFFISLYKLVTTDTSDTGFFLSLFKVKKFC